MGLVVTKLDIVDFRNWTRFELEPHPSLTVIAGPNATGKTSIIEALQLVTETVSFRKPALSETVRWGAERAAVRLEASGDGRELITELDIAASGRRVYKVNGKMRRKTAEVAGIIPCVTFTPDDLKLVKDSAEKRRSAIDGVGTQLSPSYGRIRLDYEKTVRQRNALLKEVFVPEDTLSSWTQRLMELGEKLVTHRRRLFDRLSRPLIETYREMSGGETLDVSYIPSWARDGADAPEAPAGEAMGAHLRLKDREERARGTSLVGPHRDEIVFAINGRDARAFASQGQQRTIALAWKLAEVAVITEVGAQAPILLLDDVMSELDEGRRHALTAFVGEAAQTVVTTTNLGYFEPTLLNRAAVVELA